jgi:hypothetical protein
MNRRDLLAACAAVATLEPLRGVAAPSGLQTAARDAWLYGLPLIEMAGARVNALRGTQPNVMVPSRTLTTVQTQSVTTPNNDTLYARSWIDLSKGPVTLTLPVSGTRYLSVALMDMYSNNFAVLGTRTTGPAGGTFTLVGPGDAAKGAMVVRSPTPWVWLLVRTLVDGEADLAAANAVQDAVVVKGPASTAPPPRASRNAPWQQYFAAVQALLLENPPPATDLAALRGFEPLGLTLGGGFNAERFSPAEVAQIDAGVADGKALLRSRRRPGPVVDGWIYPKSNLGEFAQDYLYRAQVAVGGLAALPPAEAMYMRAVTADGAVHFDSSQRYRLRFAADKLPPVQAFWSLTLYEATAEGQAFFTPNPINRHAIGARTPGLVKGADGSLEILMQRDDPGEGRRANWLPLPAAMPFTTVLRAYLPQDDLLQGVYRLPAMERLAG